MKILHGEPLKGLRDLPKWAAWLAQDADGAWWAYEAEPNQHDIGWYENEVGRYLRIGKAEPNQDWQNSLRRVGAL